jgi:hypothetical protein
VVRRARLDLRTMKKLSVVLLSTAAICAFASATPAAAQETITVVPKGTAPITAEPPNTSSHGPGSGHDYGPFPGLGAILAAPFDTTTSNPADTTPPKARCRVILDFNDSEARPTAVCSP